jgi:hypothetical protein
MFRLLVFVVLAAIASAEVVEKNANGLLVRYKFTVAATPADAFRGIVAVGNWWQSSHSYSGSSKNMSIVAKAGGCFCEQLPGGGEVQHMTVVYAAPGQALRMTGALGPLQQHGLAGALTFELKAAGTGTEITLTYSVGGFFPGGLTTMAEPVDGMFQEQVTSLKAYLDSATKK